ncbi:ArsR/SmtB family transcription factor [Oceanirhabdus seepicola]|uniref:Winged helix-turn-helix transcriptional regulator n=1 Tax=Oceanirhabdus seepicola TaxID=2828781 RepID=A0A9J6P0X6_9CLOT|nr:metalloregulator ArsR/SmtB family transcription factor [Oceanirhabdus seepicola]MCM1989761.1 winged helix-turn-helix transcriptional regulator [Oceanirhabdus seepicola]
MKLVKLFKALGDETRIRIINLLRHGELCVCEIESILEINQSNASRHLSKLINVGLIKNYKKAQYVYYSLDISIVENHLFINQLIKDEFVKEYRLIEDIEKLKDYKKSNITCDDIKNGRVCSKLKKA